MSEPTQPAIPSYQKFMNPLLDALRGRETLPNEELDRRVIQAMGLPPEVVAIPHKGKGGQTEVEYRIAWARTYLKKMGLLENPTRGQWRATKQGLATRHVDPEVIAEQVHRTYNRDQLEQDLIASEETAPEDSTEPLHPTLLKELRETRAMLVEEGELPGDAELDRILGGFEERFGPQVLAALDGEALLLRMHGRGTARNSLVYWLEYKNDEEFPKIAGGIAGGGAQKFGLYLSKGTWMVGNNQPITLQEAIDRARKQRDELVAGDKVLRDYTAPGPGDYRAIERELAAAAPTVGNRAWGHKYFALLHPQLLDQCNTLPYQRFQAIKLLRIPANGLYENAQIFADAAREVGISLFDLCVALHRRNGAPYRYWALRPPGEGETPPPPRDPPIARDLVIRLDGSNVQAMGWQTPSSASLDDLAMSAGPVDWFSEEKWPLQVAEDGPPGLSRLGKVTRNLVAIERRLLERRAAPAATAELPHASPALTGVVARIEAVLQRKGQVILHGPPGTGKTYWARKAIEQLAARSWQLEATDGKAIEQLKASHAVETCTFHAAYGYEDFLEGYRPDLEGGQPTFRLRDGIFKRLCDAARKQPHRRFFLLIDEINRGDIPRIFGELLTLLEKDKRDPHAISLPLSGEQFSVPKNVFIVGTMNTADRSIALLDAALRRRFGFIELMPETGLLDATTIDGLPLGAFLDALNQRIVQVVGRDGRSLQIGHSYLMLDGAPVRDRAQFVEIFRDEILPLLEEYCYEDAEALEKILDKSLVRSATGRFDDRLFSPERHGDLIQSLLRAFDTIATSPAATRAAAPDEEDDEGEAPEDR